MADVEKQFWNGFFASFSLILASEIGDKTFLTTSIFSLRYPRSVVFLSSMAALTLMNILSMILGFLTAHISPVITHYISVTLFFIFGVKMIIEGCRMIQQDSVDDLKEVQKELLDPTKEPKSLIQAYWLIGLKIFSLIFLAEWGDKSQLATILMAAKKGVWAVGLGCFAGNFVSNLVAVLSSRVLSQIISAKSVQIIGGVVFVGSSLRQLYAGL